MNETGSDEEIYEVPHTEFFYAMLSKFAAFIADSGSPDLIAPLQRTDEIYHFGKRLGLGEHEFLEFIHSEGPFLIEHHPFQICIEAEFALLISVECQVVTLVHFIVVEFV